MVPIPSAIMEALGQTDIKTTMIYVSLGKSNTRDQVEKLNPIYLIPPHLKKTLMRVVHGSHLVKQLDSLSMELS
jgi:hypothetical protein